MTEPVGVILAAGMSTRMGQPKQLLPFGDSTVLETVVDAALCSRLQRVIVVLGAYAEDILAAADLSDVEIVVNPEPERGNLSSLRAAAAVTGGAPVVLLMGDMPGLDPATIDAHLESAAAAPTWLATTTYRDGVGHPFLLSSEIMNRLDQMEGSKPLWRLTENERATSIVVSSDMPTDIDTPDDYGEALARDAVQ